MYETQDIVKFKGVVLEDIDELLRFGSADKIMTATRRVVLDLAEGMMHHPKQRTIEMRCSVKSPLCLLGGSGCVFGNQMVLATSAKAAALATSTKQEVDAKAKPFGGAEVIRSSLALMVSYNGSGIYRKTLLDDDSTTLPKFRENLAAILSNFVRISKVPGRTNKKKSINHYFFPDGINYAKIPVFEVIQLDNEDLSVVTELEAKEVTKRTIKIPPPQVLLNSILASPKYANLPNGMFNPQVVKHVKYLTRVSNRITSQCTDSITTT